MPTEAKPLFLEEEISSVPPTFREFFSEVNESFQTATTEKSIKDIFIKVRDKLALLIQDNRVSIKRAWRNRGDMGEFWHDTSLCTYEFLMALQLARGCILIPAKFGGTYFDPEETYNESDDVSNFNFDQMVLLKTDGTEIHPKLTQGLPKIFNDAFQRIIAQSNLIRREKQRKVEDRRRKTEQTNSRKTALAVKTGQESDKRVLETW